MIQTIQFLCFQLHLSYIVSGLTSCQIFWILDLWINHLLTKHTHNSTILLSNNRFKWPPIHLTIFWKHSLMDLLAFDLTHFWIDVILNWLYFDWTIWLNYHLINWLSFDFTITLENIRKWANFQNHNKQLFHY